MSSGAATQPSGYVISLVSVLMYPPFGLEGFDSDSL